MCGVCTRGRDGGTLSCLAAPTWVCVCVCVWSRSRTTADEMGCLKCACVFVTMCVSVWVCVSNQIKSMEICYQHPASSVRQCHCSSLDQTNVCACVYTCVFWQIEQKNFEMTAEHRFIQAVQLTKLPDSLQFVCVCLCSVAVREVVCVCCQSFPQLHSLPCLSQPPIDASQ